MAKPAALLFDLDGTVADTDPLHLEIFKEVFAEYGVAVDKAFFDANISGRHNREIFREWMPKHFTDAQVEQKGNDKEVLFRERARNRLQPLRGLHELLRAAQESGVRLAAVTNANRQNAEFLISQCGLSTYLTEIVIGGECARPKPAPDPYLEAVRRLGADLRGCVVFEDSVSGVTSASAARVGAVVGVATGHPPARLLAAGAHVIVQDYCDQVASLPGLGQLLASRHPP